MTITPDKATQPPDQGAAPGVTTPPPQPSNQSPRRRAFWSGFYGETVRWLAVIMSACAAYFAWQNWLNSDPVFSIFSQTVAAAADKAKFLYAVTWENVGGTTATDFSIEAISVDPAKPMSKHVLFTTSAANPITKGVRKRAATDINKTDLEDVIILCLHFKTVSGKSKNQQFYYETSKNNWSDQFAGDWHMETDVSPEIKNRLVALHIC